MQPASCATSTTVYPSRSIIHSEPGMPCCPNRLSRVISTFFIPISTMPCSSRPPRSCTLSHPRSRKAASYFPNRALSRKAVRLDCSPEIACGCCSCVQSGGGAACGSRCSGSSSGCRSCVAGGGGTACASRGCCNYSESALKIQRVRTGPSSVKKDTSETYIGII